MQIKGKADVNVEVDTKELVSALKSEVYARLDLPNPKEGRIYVKGDHWWIQRTVHTSHSFEMEENIGLALDEDVEVFTAFHTIAKFLRD